MGNFCAETIFGTGILGEAAHYALWTVTLFLVIWVTIEAMGNRENGSALAMLKVRYAKGEITKCEFESKRQDILAKVL